MVQAALLPLPVSRRGGARVAEKQTKKKLRDKAGDDEDKENQKKKRKRKKNQKKWWTTARRRGAASGLVAPTSPLPYPPSFPLHFSFPFSASHHTSSHHTTSHIIEPHLIFSSPVVCRQPVSAWGRQAHAPQILLPSLSVGRLTNRSSLLHLQIFCNCEEPQRNAEVRL